MATTKKSPTARTLEELRKRGFHPEVVERFIPRTRIRKDLYGCIDIVAIMGATTIGVQATDHTNHAHRMVKAMALPMLKEWLRGGTRGWQCWSWMKVDGFWEPRIEEVRLVKGKLAKVSYRQGSLD